MTAVRSIHDIVVEHIATKTLPRDEVILTLVSALQDRDDAVAGRIYDGLLDRDFPGSEPYTERVARILHEAFQPDPVEADPVEEAKAALEQARQELMAAQERLTLAYDQVIEARVIGAMRTADE